MLVYMSDYRQKPTCTVDGCEAPVHVLKSGLCVRHYARMRKHGSTDPTRYGEKKQHPLWMRWRELLKRGVLAPEWHDFWAFVEGVGPKPEDAKKLYRLDSSAPYGPGNFAWRKTPTREEKLAYLRAYHHADPDRHRNSLFQRKYGISLAEYNAMYETQGGACAICRRGESRFIKRNSEKRRMLCVDHDHETGAVRGLLCADCNVALGAFQDDEERLLVAAQYLIKRKDAKAS